jgi:hypothetical protein
LERPYTSTFFEFGEWQARGDEFTDLDLYSDSDSNGWSFLYTPCQWGNFTNGRAQLCMFFQERTYAQRTDTG